MRGFAPTPYIHTCQHTTTYNHQKYIRHQYDHITYITDSNL
ncbi:hypothetical protein [Shigella phage ESh4]|nr:hypothetical protein [Shigella phage ESh4]